MRKFSRLAAVAFVGVALTTGGLTAPAAANGSQAATVVAGESGDVQVTTHKRGGGVEPPAGMGNPSEWGVVEIDMDSSTESVSPLAENCVDPASGGRWCFGWYTTTVGGEPRKLCYSNYLHGSKYHSSTAELGGYSVKRYADAGRVSNASRTAGFAYTCKTYYAIY